MKTGTTNKDEGDREKKPVQESLGRVAEESSRQTTDPAEEETSRFQKKTGQIERDPLGR
ncbi:MAG TPA: hypothetical protein VM029_04560 [Opitutaceae bacterium]|nr:hypothetical protein [Opitutaceae bacterium]